MFFRPPWDLHYLVLKWGNTGFPSLTISIVDHTAHFPIFSDLLQETLWTHFTLPRWHFWPQRDLRVVYCIIVWTPSVGLGVFGCSKGIAMLSIYLCLLLGGICSQVSATINEMWGMSSSNELEARWFLQWCSSILTLPDPHWKKPPYKRLVRLYESCRMLAIQRRNLILALPTE